MRHRTMERDLVLSIAILLVWTMAGNAEDVRTSDRSQTVATVAGNDEAVSSDEASDAVSSDTEKVQTTAAISTSDGDIACAVESLASCGSCCDADQSNEGLFDPIFTVGDPFKNMPMEFFSESELFDGSRLSYGGDLRLRVMDETDRLRLGGPGRSTYNLWRWRNHLDFRAGDQLRIYAELLDATQFGEDLAVTGIDVNRWNLQNLFADIAVLQRDGKPTTLRIGRQELEYGSTQLVSPLDWANTRRNFEGFRIMSGGDVWDFDAFATRPVNTATFLNPLALGENPVTRFDNEHDEADDTRWFSGVYATYKGIENQTFEGYWFWLETDNGFDAATGPGSVGGNRHTFGIRWLTSQQVLDNCQTVQQVWNLELEGAFQVGEDVRVINLTPAEERDVIAGSVTTKFGVTLPQVPWSPTFKFLYYWSSGDDDPADGKDNTFSTLFPFGHFYWGLIDNLSGQNLNDLSLQSVVKPTDQFTLLTALHWFSLANNNDVLYNVAGVPFGKVNSLSDIGQEVDLVGTYKVNDKLVVQAGYLWFFYGSWLTSNPLLARDDAGQFYLQTVFKY